VHHGGPFGNRVRRIANERARLPERIPLPAIDDGTRRVWQVREHEPSRGLPVSTAPRKKVPSCSSGGELYVNRREAIRVWAEPKRMS
jgi:hypothetical protein